EPTWAGIALAPVGYRPAGLPIRCAVGQSRPPVARPLACAWSLGRGLQSAAEPVVPARPWQTATLEFGLGAWFARRRNPPAAPGVACVLSRALGPTAPP